VATIPERLGERWSSHPPAACRQFFSMPATSAVTLWRIIFS
jgi:hypothetical protein